MIDQASITETSLGEFVPKIPNLETYKVASACPIGMDDYGTLVWEVKTPDDVSYFWDFGLLSDSLNTNKGDRLFYCRYTPPYAGSVPLQSLHFLEGDDLQTIYKSYRNVDALLRRRAGGSQAESEDYIVIRAEVFDTETLGVPEFYAFKGDRRNLTYRIYNVWLDSGEPICLEAYWWGEDGYTRDINQFNYSIVLSSENGHGTRYVLGYKRTLKETDIKSKINLVDESLVAECLGDVFDISSRFAIYYQLGRIR